MGCTGYRLPTEAEWEYAARAGTETLFYFGDVSGDNLARAAWYSANSGSDRHRTGQLRPNQWGLYDILGNLDEWVFDDLNLYDGGFAQDPVQLEAAPGDDQPRALRGGNFNGEPIDLRSGSRGWAVPEASSVTTGLR